MAMASLRDILVAITWLSMTAQSTGLKPGPDAIPFNSTRGRLMLAASTSNLNLNVMQHFIQQESLAYCGPTSAVIAMNALLGSNRVMNVAPVDPRYNFPSMGLRFPYFTQDSFVSQPCVQRVLNASGTYKGGMTLPQLKESIECWDGVSASIVHVHDLTGGPKELQKILQSELEKLESVVLVQVDHDQADDIPGHGGHFSPLASYHANGTDATVRFLFMDVARYKFPPIWITTNRLFAAMNTTDPSTGRSRGFAIVRPLSNKLHVIAGTSGR